MTMIKYEKLNALVTEMDQDHNNGGPLSGKKILIKDNVSTKDVLTTASTGILQNYVPVFDSTLVTLLKEAGAHFVGKTTMDELALGGTGLTPYSGPTKNPYDTSRISGGSSSGSAALMATGDFDFAIGSDTGDSIRKPASYCGVIGFKPSYGLISRYGVIPYASSLDHLGYFSKDVESASTLLNVLAKYDPKDSTSINKDDQEYSIENSDLKGKKIGVIVEVNEAMSETELKARYLELLDQLEQQGAQIVECHMNQEYLNAILPVYYIIANCEATANHANLDGVRFGVSKGNKSLEDIMIRSRTEGFGTLLKKRFVIGAYGLDDKHQEEIFRKAQRVRRLIVQQYREILETVDVVIRLSADSIAPTKADIESRKLTLNQTIAENHLVLDNFAGTPSITLPLGFSDGLPYGVSIAANNFKDKVLLEISKGVESIIDFKTLEKEANPWLMK